MTMCYCIYQFQLGHRDVVALLVENKADVNARNKYDNTPCDVVKEWGKLSINALFLVPSANAILSRLFHSIVSILL